MEERKMQAMGFTAAETEEAFSQAPFEKEDALFTFDSGRFISFAASLTHTLVLGTTNSGKTTCVLMPALYRDIMAGNYGIIGDPKGNMGESVAAKAAEAGREEDYLCIGTHPGAAPLNYISGMSPVQFYDFISSITRKSFDNASNNMDFVVKGLAMTMDCYQLLLYLAETLSFHPTLETIEEMISKYEAASALFDTFKSIADAGNMEHQKFIKMIENSEYHPLNMNAERVQDLRKDKEHNHFMQLEYNLQQVKQALKIFLETPGIREKFCAANASGLNMDKVILEHKLLHLHFLPDSGAVGGQICRDILNRFYESVYRLGLQKRVGQSFVCLDEFQEMADLSEARFSDTSFISQARQFSCHFLAATQSVSALYNRARNIYGVEALLANCNNKVILFSDDPATRGVVARYSPAVDPIDFKRGECFAVTYDSYAGEHIWGCERVQGGYEYGQTVVPVSLQDGGSGERGVSLAQLDEMLQAKAADAKGSPRQAKGGNAEARNRKTWQFGLKREINTGKTDEREDDMRNSMEDQDRKDNRENMALDNDLAREFPALFEDGCQCVVPVGWRPYVRNCLEMIMQVQLNVTIHRIGINMSGELEAVCTRKGYAAAFLNKLFKKTSTMCMECGSRIYNPQSGVAVSAYVDEEDPYDLEEPDVPMLMCENCLSSFQLGRNDSFQPF